MTPLLKIVILEDCSIDAELIQDFLTEKGMNCEFNVADSKEAFLHMLSQFQPDVILSDHSMPLFSSSEALIIARGLYPEIPFIIVAGVMPEELVINIMKLGASDYISKEKLDRLPTAIKTATRLYWAEKEKQEALEQLIISEKNYHTVFLKSPLPKWIYDSETMKFLEVNEAAIQQYGYSREEFLQMTLYDIRPKEDVEMLVDYVKRFKLSPNSRPSLWQHTKKDGQIILVEVNAHTIIYNNRNARMAIINDVTERRKAEQKILQSEANLKIIFDNTSEGFVLLDREATIMAFNNKAEIYNIFSKTKKFRLGHSIYDFIPDSRKPFFQNVMEKVLNGESFQYERSYKSGNGVFWLEFSVSPVMVDDEIKGACFSGHDITEKKLTEQEREFDRNNLKALINNTNDLMWSIDRNFRLITSNEAFDKTAKNLFGTVLSKGKNLMEVDFNKERLDRFKAHYEKAFLGESFTETEFMAEGYWSDVSFYPIYNDGEIIGAACFSRNITWQKKAEEERMEYIKSLEEMLFKISHQLRVPIANLLGIAHVVEFPDNSEEEIKEIVSYIKPSVSDLDTFSRDLAKFIGTILSKNKMLTIDKNKPGPNSRDL
jgi:PAS domain S-box-containing protein